MHDVYISLGSNIGHRKNNLIHAIQWLESYLFQIIQSSRVIETEPYGPIKQKAFLNQVIVGKTSLAPLELLVKIKWIENKMGRIQTVCWGPRIIDLDILFFDDLVLSIPELTIPHPDIENRLFVLKPLLELNPNLIHPKLQKSIQDLWNDYQRKEPSLI